MVIFPVFRDPSRQDSCTRSRLQSAVSAAWPTGLECLCCCPVPAHSRSFSLESRETWADQSSPPLYRRTPELWE